MRSHDETNTAEIITKMFEEVLEYVERMEEERVETGDYPEDHGSGIGACSVNRDQMNPGSEKEANEQKCEETENIEELEDELLTFPPSGILSPLSKSVEAVVTPLVRSTLTELLYKSIII